MANRNTKRKRKLLRKERAQERWARLLRAVDDTKHQVTVKGARS